MIYYSMQLNWQRASTCARELFAHSRWSKCVYGYMEASFLCMIKEEGGVSVEDEKRLEHLMKYKSFLTQMGKGVEIMLICLQNFPVIQATNCRQIHTDRKVLNQESSPLFCARRATLFAIPGTTLLLELFSYHGKEIKFDRTLLSARGSYS